MSTSCRRSSIEKGAKLHFLSLGRVLTVLTQEQADYIGVKIDVPFKGGHHRCWIQGLAEGVIVLRRLRKSQ